MSIAESELKVGDRVVYANQGVCRVVGTTQMEIAGQRQEFIKLSREDDQATVMVPKGRLDKVGLRRIADPAELQKVFAYLAAPVEGPELDWKVRHRTHGERMSEGGLMGLAQIVKSLTTLADLRPLPPKERELYDNARHLLVLEVAASASLPEVSAEDAVDLAMFPPGQERKKPALAMALGDGEEGDELGLDEGLETPALEAPGLDEAGLSEEPEAAEGEEEGPGGQEDEERDEEELPAGEEEEPEVATRKAAPSKKPAAAEPRESKAPKAKKPKEPKAAKAPAKPKKAKPETKAKPAPKAKAAKPAAKAKPKKK